MEGEKQTSAGYNQANQAMVQDISNGMCLCANCHKMIDKNNSDDFHLTELKKEGGA